MAMTDGSVADPAGSAWLPPDELHRRQTASDRLLAAEGAGHVVHDLPVRADGRVVALESRPWRLDPHPYVLDAATFARLEAAVAERALACEAVIGDLYGQRRLVTERIVDPAALWATARYRMAAVGARRPHRWLTTYAVDVVRGVDGRWHVVQDLTDAPAGFGYALLGRAVFGQVVRPTPRHPRPLEPYLATLRRGLAETSSADGPRIVVFTGGIDHPSYVEHSYLATKLGYHLVEGADLVVRQRRLWLRTLSGLEPIDVLHRRLEDHRLDPMEVNAAGVAGVPGVLLAASAGSASIANAHGAGVMEAPELALSWDEAIEVLSGSRPMLPLRSPAAAPAGSTVDQIIGAEVERVPVFLGGEVVARPMVLRLHAVVTDDGVTVVPGGNGRVLDEADDPRIPTPCIAKDVWVLGVEPLPAVLVPPVPQVDLIASVPTRAADSLYWLGRAAERAEVVARAARVALTEREASDSPTPSRIVVALTGSDATTPDEALSVAGVRIVLEIGTMLAEAASVREFLSTTAGRVLGAMADVRGRLQHALPDVEILDEVLLQLSAFSGLWNESVVRGPAWHFGDYARRYERAVAVLESVAAVIDDATTDTVLLESLLATHDSLVAYRRRHRSDVELTAVLSLLVRDERNPRSVRASLDALLRDAAAIDWTDGVDGLDAVRDGLVGLGGRAQVEAAIAMLHGLAGRLTATRLATPPDPAVIRSVRPLPQVADGSTPDPTPIVSADGDR